MLIYKDDSMEIFEHNGIYTIRYDSGDHFGTIREIEVTEEEAMRAQESEEAAERIIIHHQNIELFGEDYMNR